MSIGKLAVLAVALAVVSGGFGAALADWNRPEPGPAIDLVDVDARKADEDGDGTLATEEEGDGDDTAGNDGTAVGQNAPEPQQQQPQAAGDGDQTAGNDGTAGGDNTQAAPAPIQPVPAGAVGGGGQSDDSDGGGGDDSGGGDT
jgi:hypothetical protein